MISDMLKRYKQWFELHKREIEEAYFHFLRFRSISTEAECKSEVEACAEWVKTYLANIGFETQLIQTEGHPVVYGEDLQAGPSRPTVLIYGHYDVQPVDPIELWKSAPFEPTLRDGKIFARGAVDDKGQIFFAIVALKAMKEIGERLPINVKFCIEGEEEASSVGLSLAIPKIKSLLKSDYLLVADFGTHERHTPAINLGARGILSMDVVLTGSKGDLHSGMCGGIAYNPNRALVELLSQLYHKDGSVAVEGFYDDVTAPSKEEVDAFLPPYDKTYYAKEFGITAFGGEKGKSLSETNLFRPVLEINGIGGGYSGSGFKTVIPAQAIAKISCRLVPRQDPEKVGEAIAAFLKKKCPAEMKIEVKLHNGAAAYRANPHSKIAIAVAQAAEEVMGKKCKKELSGASIPIVGALSEAAGAEVVGMGYCLPTDQIHAPNEHFDMERFEWGFLTVARSLERL